MFDEQSQDFVEAAVPAAPYTHVVVDVDLEVCAIAARSRLAPRAEAIAGYLERVLNHAEVANGAFEVRAIKNPRNFIETLRTAYAVQRFQFTFGLPNAFDVQKAFIKPAQQLVRDAGADYGTAELKGVDLDREIVEELARSTAATGNDVSARVRMAENSKPVKIRFGKRSGDLSPTGTRVRGAADRGAQTLARPLSPSAREPSLTFWRWFLAGTRHDPGYKGIVNPWLLAHVAFGSSIALIAPATLQQASSSVLLPVGAVFVGMAFAWVGNAQALMQTDEIDALAREYPGGFEGYVFTFQAAILVILATLTLWSFAGLGVFDLVWPTHNRALAYGFVAAVLYSCASLSVRECWHVVVGTQLMLLTWRT